LVKDKALKLKNSLMKELRKVLGLSYKTVIWRYPGWEDLKNFVKTYPEENLIEISDCGSLLILQEHSQ